MTTITQSIIFKWKIGFDPKYKFTSKGKLYNCQTMREIKKTVNGYSVGYWLSKKFYTIHTLRKCLAKIETENCPF